MDNNFMNQYSIYRPDYKPWSLVYIYNDGRKVAQYRASLEDIEEGKKARPYGIQKIKVRKPWECEVCEKQIQKGEEAIVFTGRYEYKTYAHVNCINFY
jgi:hypothetical protein